MSLSSEQSDRNGTSQNENMRFPTVRVVKEGEVKKGSRTGKSTEKFDVILDENASASPKDPSFQRVGKCVSVATKRANLKLNKKTDAFYEVKLVFECNTLTLAAHGDCSRSWFETLEGQSLKSLEGTEIIDFQEGIEKIKMPLSGVDVCDKNELNVFIIRNPDGTTRPFVLILRNSSNGYYCGYIHAEWEFKFHSNTPIPNTAYLTVIVGLPGCGKSTYMRNHYDTEKVKYFDDYLDEYSFNGREIMNALMRGEHVIIADPRLCDRKVFTKEVVETFIANSKVKRRANLLDAKTQMTVVFFSNNPYQSVLNVIKREDTDNADKRPHATAINIDERPNYGELIRRDKIMSYIQSISNLHERYQDFLCEFYYCASVHGYKVISKETYEGV